MSNAFDDLVPSQSAPMQPKGFKTPYGDVVQGGFTGLPSMQDVKAGFGNSLGVVADVGRDIVNMPHNLSGGRIAPGVDPNFDYYNALGGEKGMDTEIAKGLIESAPFFKGAQLATQGSKLLSKAPNLSTNILSSTAYGAAENKQNRGEGAFYGGLAGAGGTVFGKAAEKLIFQPISKAIANQSYKPLLKKIIGATEDLDANAEAQSFQKLYDAQVKQEDAVWKSLEKEARGLDGQRANSFNGQKYTDKINKIEREANLLEPSEKLDYLTSLDYLNAPRVGAKAIAPQSISGAIATNKGLNKAYKDFIKKEQLPDDDNAKKIIEDIKKSTRETVGENLPPEQNAEFQEMWNSANKETQNTMKFYGVNPNKSYKALKEQLTAKNAKVDEGIFDYFTPKKGQTDTAGLERLSELMGDKNAQRAMRAYVTRDMGKGKPLEALAKYSKLKPEFRKQIFKSTKEGELLESALKIQKQIEKNPHRFWMHMGMGAGVPALLGFGGAKLMGEDWDNAAMMGAGVGLAALGGAKGAASLTPYSKLARNKIIDVAQNGLKNTGRLPSLALNSFALNGDKNG